jgi:hypothetical protein
MPTLKAFVRVGLCIPVFFLSLKFPVFGYIGTKQFEMLPVISRMLYIWIAVFMGRFIYHFAWYLTEEGNIASGLGFNPDPVTKNVSWDALNNCNTLKTEFNTSLVDVINNWNKGVNDWLKYGKPKNIIFVF